VPDIKKNGMSSLTANQLRNILARSNSLPGVDEEYVDEFTKHDATNY
jgi:hypothetical protein